MWRASNSATRRSTRPRSATLPRGTSPPAQCRAGRRDRHRQTHPRVKRPGASLAIARALIRDGKRGRFFNVVELVNKLEAEGRAGRQGRMAEYLCRMDFIILDELGYLPFAQS